MEILVKVKVADGIEMEVRGGPESFVEAVDQLPTMVSKVRSALASTTSTPFASPVEAKETESLPTIGKPKGLQDAIMKVVSTAWGKSKPRTWKEIDAVLKQNALHVSKGSSSGSLTLLMQAGKLRRLKEGTTYGYTLPISKNEIEEEPIVSE